MLLTSKDTTHQSLSTSCHVTMASSASTSSVSLYNDILDHIIPCKWNLIKFHQFCHLLSLTKFLSYVKHCIEDIMATIFIILYRQNFFPQKVQCHCILYSWAWQNSKIFHTYSIALWVIIQQVGSCLLDRLHN